MHLMLFPWAAFFLFLAAGTSQGVQATLSARCPLGPPLKGEEVLVGYLTDSSESSVDGVLSVGPFRALAILDGKVLHSTYGSSIRDGMRFWPLLPSEPEPVALASLASHRDRFAEGECVYHASIVPSRLPQWTILASKPLPGLLRVPTSAERSEFHRLNPNCVYQGDHEPEENVPCETPHLVAVSDLNSNGKQEYWATEPYMWDTGFVVQELGSEGKLTNLISVCPCCSD